MKIERAGSVLGPYCSQLGIESGARIVLYPQDTGLGVWDLKAEIQHELGIDGQPKASAPKSVPREIKTILADSDEALKERLKGAWWPWARDMRETIRTELKCREVGAGASKLN